MTKYNVLSTSIRNGSDLHAINVKSVSFNNCHTIVACKVDDIWSKRV